MRNTDVSIAQMADMIRQGSSRKQAAAAVGWKYETFKAHVYVNRDHLEVIRTAEADKTFQKSHKRPVEKMDFAQFRTKVFDRHTFPHMRQWVEWMQDPEAQHILIVTFPDAAKSQVARDWLLYRLALDTRFRAAYVTHSADRAKATVGAIRATIEDNISLRAVAGDLKPESRRVWASDKILVGQRSFARGQDQIDYSLAGFGHETQIAGARLDAIVVDDIDGKPDLSVNERRAIFENITSVYKERLGPTGRLIVICNRWDEQDVAGLIIEQAQQHPGLWNVHVTPAIVRERNPADPKDWGEVTWPERFGLPRSGYDPHIPIRPRGKWTNKRAWKYFSERRMILGTRRFALRYQNDPLQDTDRDFTPDVLEPALERGKDVSVRDTGPGITLVTLDPATVEPAAVMGARLRPDGKVVILDAEWDKNKREPDLREWVSDYATTFRAHYVGIEGQGPFRVWAESDAVRDDVSATGGHLVVLKTSGQTKYADDVGVSSLVPFVRDRLVIPQKTEHDRERMQQLLWQLRNYRPPDTSGRTTVRSSAPYDLVMCLWFVARLIWEYNLDPSRPPSRSTFGVVYGDFAARADTHGEKRQNVSLGGWGNW